MLTTLLYASARAAYLSPLPYVMEHDMQVEQREPMRRASKHDEPDMDLPEGKTCSDCAHFRRCNLIFGHIAADEVCDWSPSRFHPKAA